MGILEQIGEAIADPKGAINKAKEEVTDKVKDEAKELSDNVFKATLDKLGLSSFMESILKFFGADGVFSFLGLGNKDKKDASKEQKDSTPNANLGADFQKMFEESLTNGGKAVRRLINNKQVQGIKSACYNLAENFRHTKFNQNLLNQQPSFQNNDEKEEMRAAKYLTTEIDNYPVGTVFWVQANIDPSDIESRNSKNGNHWLTYVGKNEKGQPLIADQNDVRPVREDDFYSKRFVHKVYPPSQTA